MRADKLGKSSRGNCPGGQAEKGAGTPMEKMGALSHRRQLKPDFFAIDDELCIWMKARVINFKLCDRTYDCLNCAFDKAMTEAWSKSPRVGDQ